MQLKDAIVFLVLANRSHEYLEPLITVSFFITVDV